MTHGTTYCTLDAFRYEADGRDYEQAKTGVVTPATRKCIEHIQRGRKHLQDRVNQFTDELKSNFTYTMSWADLAVSCAAKLEVYDYLVAKLQNGVTLTCMQNWLQREVRSGAMFPPSSTSQFSNVVALQKLSAKAEALGLIEDYLQLEREKKPA